MSKCYGRITLAKDDIDYLKKGLRAAESRMSEQARRAVDVHEIAFYDRGALAFIVVITKLENLKPGTHGFSEDELNTLRSVLSYETGAALVREYQEVKAANPVRAAEIGTELDYRQQLGARLERPFRQDRSQDPETEEDDMDVEEEMGLAG
jgi:ASC-1-like (ASCH) protein